MCVIVHKPKGAKLDWVALENCMDNNPHGAGVAIVGKDGVTIDKGYFDFKTFREGVEEACKGHECVLHFRISTSGLVDAGSTHPFPLSADMNEIRLLDTTTQRAIAHNGITSYGDPVELVTASDTMLLVRDVLAGIESTKQLKRAVRNIASKTHGRFALVTPYGVKRFGEGWKWHGGVCYSNTSYDPFYYTYRYSWASYGDYRWDEESRCEWCGAKAEPGGLCPRCKKALGDYGDSPKETFLCDWCGEMKNVSEAVEVYGEYLLCTKCVAEWQGSDQEEEITQLLLAA